MQNKQKIIILNFIQKKKLPSFSSYKENKHELLLFRQKPLAAPSIDKTERQTLSMHQRNAQVQSQKRDTIKK